MTVAAIEPNITAETFSTQKHDFILIYQAITDRILTSEELLKIHRVTVQVPTMHDNKKCLLFDLSSYHVVLFAPIKATCNIQINPKSVITLSDICSTEGTVKINASMKFVRICGNVTGSLGTDIKAPENCIYPEPFYFKGKPLLFDLRSRRDMILGLFHPAIESRKKAVKLERTVEVLIEIFDTIRNPTGTHTDEEGLDLDFVLELVLEPPKKPKTISEVENKKNYSNL